MKELGGGLLLINHGGHFGAHGRDELGCEAHCGVDILDRFLCLFNRHVRKLTDVVEATVTEEVPIRIAVPVDGLLHDHAAPFTTLLMAGATE
ncbi:hypothetical protein [Streptomyces sp. NBC_01236]|uniref:hypothetical protein n=1 Tax=Streptomyces sp. NBC_01236 TaxID=2903789 RepID=UPI002E14883B|nr:hypothetical protein OG324_09010 [Streptomyces sp. NBC_01236]